MSGLHSLRRFWRMLAHYLRPEWTRLLLLALTLAVTIGVQVVSPLVVSRFIDRATSGATLHVLTLLALTTVALALFGQIATVAETYLAENVSWAATNRLREDLLAHLLGLDASFHTAHTPGELIERVDGDVSLLANFFSRLLVYVAGNGLLMLAVLALLFRVDWWVGLSLAVFALLGLIGMLQMGMSATPDWVADRQASAAFYGFIGETLVGLEDIRSSGAGGFVLRRWAELLRHWLPLRLRAGMWGYALYAAGQALFAVGTALAFAFSAALYHSGTLTIGGAYLIFQYIVVLRQPMEQIRDQVQELQQAAAGIGRIEALLTVQPRIVNGPGTALPPGPLAVELDRVSFGYAPEVPALRDVSLCLPPGRVLGVVGRTGSGKTTFTRLLPRFYDPQAGVVRLGGVDVRETRVDELRRRIGLVGQEVQLFNASLRDNLTLFDGCVPDDRVRAVLDELGLSDWLEELPEGLDTLLGPGGLGLSAGEAQLLACARVFLLDPDLVILDEASSRLDPAAERRLHVALGRLLQGRTGIIVAHRLSTIAYADDVVVLEEGRVREYGPREALAADACSQFAQLLRVAAGEVVR